MPQKMAIGIRYRQAFLLYRLEGVHAVKIKSLILSKHSILVFYQKTAS